jgi:uncharacterized protein (TIGR00730 family)
MPINSIGVFCGSNDGVVTAHQELAVELGTLCGQRGINIVYGGGAVGLMGAVANAALIAGGRVIGVIPENLFRQEVEHDGVTELHRVVDMHARKTMMYDRSDAFVILPGGLGTFEELFEAATWNQLGLHGSIKPITLLGDQFFAPLTAMLDTMVTDGFVRPEWRDTIIATSTPTESLDVLSAIVGDDSDDPPWDLGER